MSDYEIVEARGDYRVMLEADTDAAEPYDDGQSPVIRYDSAGYNGSHCKHVAPTWKSGREANIEAAADRWGPPNRPTWHLFETYMRAFHGTTQIETYYSGSYDWYITYDSAEWREHTGASGPDLTEYKAWTDGDVYGYVVQKRVPLFNEAGEFALDTWDDVDSLWGLYGYGYAIQSAREALDDAVESESK